MPSARFPLKLSRGTDTFAATVFTSTDNMCGFTGAVEAELEEKLDVLRPCIDSAFDRMCSSTFVVGCGPVVGFHSS